MPFYSRFEVPQNEIRLDDVNAVEGIITVRVPLAIASKIHVETCSDDVLVIEKGKASTSVLTYRIMVSSINKVPAIIYALNISICVGI